MVQKITGEAPFQVLATNFSISPSTEGYTLQISADGVNYTDLFAVGANVTRMVTGVANGSYYRLSGNNSTVTINWRSQCTDGQSGGGGGEGSQGPQGPMGPQGYQGPAGGGSVDLSEYWTSAETQTAIQNEAQQIVGYVDELQEQTIAAIPEAVSQLINDEEYVSSGNLKTINNESIVGTGNISIQGGDNNILKSSSGTPENIGVGDVYAVTSNTRILNPQEVVSSVTVTYTGSEITFKFYAGDEYKTEQGGLDGDGNPWGAWGMEGDVILGPWGATYGIQVTSSGNEYTFTTLNPGDYESSQMYGFNIDVYVPGLSSKVYQFNGSEGEKLLKTEDLPADNRLVPNNGNFNDFLRMGGEGPEWYSIRQVPYSDHDKDYTGAVLMSKSTYADEYGWGFIDNAVLDPVSAAPITANDGAVYALSSSGYGIVQAQSAHTGMTWVNFEGKTFPQGTITKVRVPYNDTVESNIQVFRTDPNGEGDWSLYWHPEDPNDRHWDGVPDGYSQNDGEFNAVDQWGNTMVATKVGNYIEVTFGAPLYDGEWESISTHGNLEAYAEVSVADYKGVVMSNAITNIWRGTQAEYNALSPNYDNNTFYIIL